MAPEHPVGLDSNLGAVAEPLSIKARPADAPSGQPCATFFHNKFALRQFLHITNIGLEWYLF